MPSGLGPGDLVSSEELSAGSDDDSGFPTGARVWRILYVSTGVDETDLELICGLVALPVDGPREFAGSGGSSARMLAWSHGTIGLDQRCLPSSDPATHFWGKMPGGINAISWGSLLGKHEGKPSGGALQYALDQGWAVTASDYQPTDTYVMGKIAGANVLDAARAGSQLADQIFEDSPSRYQMMPWGHSQGGHAALWAGQLAESYLEATTPSRPTASLDLAAVVALAPATNFLTDPELQPGTDLGDGLADWEMHQTIKLVPLPSQKFDLQIGPALFSYIFGSWEQYSQGPTPAQAAQFPAFPAAATELDESTVATNEGHQTISTVEALCLGGPDALDVQTATAPYHDAEAHRMLQPEMWNLPDEYEPGDDFRGGVGKTCAGTADPSMEDWCDWIRWNMPGPLGDNPFPKIPSVDGNPVPILIGQGTYDQIIHCQVPEGGDPEAVPDAANCMSRAYYESMAADAYCPDGNSLGHLQLVGVPKSGLSSPGSHFAIPGLMSAAKIGRSSDDLRFEGSPVQEFMVSAFEGDLDTGCGVHLREP